MNAKIVSQHKDLIAPLLNFYGIIEKDSEKPDIIVTYGGDGSLLIAEQKYPNTPKLALRDTITAKLCPKHSTEDIVKSFINGILKKTSTIKISTFFNGKEIIALNDIFIHNTNRVTAIRYEISIDDEVYEREIASDSLGISTPHGSTAYFKSITGTVFRVGIGIAFSNSRERKDHIIVSEDSVIRVKLLRGPAIMVADNTPEVMHLTVGDKIEIKKSETPTIIYGLDEFMCVNCRRLRNKKLIAI